MFSRRPRNYVVGRINTPVNPLTLHQDAEIAAANQSPQWPYLDKSSYLLYLFHIWQQPSQPIKKQVLHTGYFPEQIDCCNSKRCTSTQMGFEGFLMYPEYSSLELQTKPLPVLVVSFHLMLIKGCFIPIKTASVIYIFDFK